MRPQALSQIAAMCGGRLHGDDATVDGIVTDTRALPQAGSNLFVALRGPNFDGHDHVAAAAAGGCVAALVARESDAGIAQVVVADPQRALAAWASVLQRQRATRVAAITGSNGKTSVKNLLHAILSRAGRTHATPGNRNNEIGLPLAVIDAPEDADYAIYEMGTGAPGDIKVLTDIVAPDVALVNNVAPAHLERMGSLLEIANTKAAVYDALRDGGVAVINADDAFAPYFADRAHGHRIVRFALEATADVTADDIQADATGSRFVLRLPGGERAIALALAGRHNVRNALAAAAMAHAFGVGLDAIADGLQGARAVAGRLHTHRLRGGAVLIDDAYNANPGSVHAAIGTLGAGAGAGEAWLVLGDMLELGADEAALHAEAGRRAKAAGIARLYALGPLSAHAAQAFGEGGQVFDSHAALADALRAELARGVRVLVKGSRGSAMDRIVASLLDEPGEDADAA